MRSPIAVLAVLAFLLVPATAARAARAQLGIADQKADVFADQRLADLHIRKARLSLPWDVLRDPGTLPRTDEWMRETASRGIVPLVAIDRSRRPGLAAVNPTPAQLASEVRQWRQRWPQIHELSTWNEGNINKKPRQVARWYNAVRRACQGCTVLGADLVDTKNMTRWAKQFVHYAGRQPAAWGVHNYVAVNNFRKNAMARDLKALGRPVWLTETGGVVSRRNPRARFQGSGTAFAARATRFLLQDVVEKHPQIKRVYIYTWKADEAEGGTSWDSGIIAPDGTARPAFAVLQAWVASGRAATKR